MSSDSPLVDYIRQAIRQSPHHCLSFYEFMKLALYHPAGGYYGSGKEIVGKEGDYYTSVSVHAVFAEVLADGFARYAATLWPGKTFALVEFGAGEGRFARQVLDALFEFHPGVYQRLQYFAVESQEGRLRLEGMETHLSRLQVLREWRKLPKLEGICFSNEFVDALPVHWVRREEGRLCEVFVTWEEGKGRFTELTRPVEDERILSYLRDEGIELAEGEQVEVNLLAEIWLRDVARWLQRGLLMTIDYGGVAAELSRTGTLRAYYRHQVSSQLFARVGEQDITSDVNFSALMRWGERAGFHNFSLASQRHLLLEWGILRHLQDGADDPFSPAARKNRAIRQLILPESGMGDRFQVLLQHKGLSEADVRSLK